MNRLPVLLLLAIALAGCGGGKSKEASRPTPTPKPTATPTPKPLVVKPLLAAKAGRVKAHMPKERVVRILGRPLLEQAPTSDFAGGCIFYPLAKLTETSVWQFCFDKRGINLVLTALSQSHPRPPRAASQARTALIGRADTICQSEYARLPKIAAPYRKARARLAQHPNAANAKRLAAQIARFQR